MKALQNFGITYSTYTEKAPVSTKREHTVGVHKVLRTDLEALRINTSYHTYVPWDIKQVSHHSDVRKELSLYHED